jgi:glycosyltransferase involved in cell wall biosynthesis
MNAPKVTVMMMVYNAERYLRQAIDSVLGQTFTDFELLILDDASTDRCLEIIESYSDLRIRIIRNESNRGVAYSRSKVLPLARGEYVAVLDADDIALPERLQVQVSYLDSHPDICLVGSAYQVIGDDGSVKSIYRQPADLLTIRWLLLFGNCFAHSTVMFRKREVLLVGGYDAAVYAGEDIDLFVRLVAAGYKLTNLEHPLVQWRCNPDGLSNTEPPANKDHFIWGVVRSVYLQSGLEIDFVTARCLYRAIPRPGLNRQVAINAYATLKHCLAAYLRSARNESERRELILLAMDDVVRLAEHNPSTRLYGISQLLTYLSWIGLRSSLEYRSLRSVARILSLPKPLVRWLSKAMFGSALRSGKEQSRNA